MHYLFLIILILQTGCGRIKNTISVARLDCGSETTLSGSYLRFVDKAGNDLDRKNLDIRSLDDNEGQVLEVTSKGCLTANQPGLWMVRHKEKLEGLVLNIEANHQSGIQQLQDISQETLKPSCPSSDLSSTLDPSVFTSEESNRDKRGYLFHMSIREKTSDKPIDLPWLNLAMTKPTLVGTMVKEGEAMIDIELKNQFRFGEIEKRSCPVRFDYTAPITFASVQKNAPVQYRSRPFYILNAEDDLSLVSENTDISFHEVCWQLRKDWNEGNIEDKRLSLCTNPQTVGLDKSVALSERKGFWQLQYRSVDKAGNRSEWSNPEIILLQQTSKLEALKAKAAGIAAIVEAKPVDGAASAMVAALELYNNWLELPTKFERERLESIILLSFHRPWMRDTIRQNLQFQEKVNAMFWDSVSLDGGSKIVAYERNLVDYNNKFMEVRLYDAKTFSSRSLFKIHWDHVSRTTLTVSDDDQKFIFGVSAAHSFWVGELRDGEIEITEIDAGDSLWSARFVNNDQQIVAVTTSGKLTYDAQRLQDEPLRETNLLSELPDVEELISDQGTHLLVQDWPSKTMTWTPISDESLETEVIDLTQIGIRGSVESFDVIGPNRYFIAYTDEQAGPCVYSIISKNSTGEMDVERISERAPCVYRLRLAKSGDRVFMDPDNENRNIGTLLLSNLKNFAKVIPFPVKRMSEGGMSRAEGPWERGYSVSGKFLAAQYYDPGWDAKMVVWERSPNGEYKQIVKSKIGHYEKYAPAVFAEDLGLVISLWSRTFHVTGYLPETLNIFQEYEVDGCTVNTATYLGRGKVLIGCLGGRMDVYDISNHKAQLMDQVRPSPNIINELQYEPVNNLLLMGVQDADDLWIWPDADLHGIPRKLKGFRSSIQNFSLSHDKKFLAASSFDKEEMVIKVFQLHNLEAPPIILEGHNSKIRDLSFFGSGSLLISGTDDGILKIWDVSNPDFPGVTIPMQRGGNVRNLTGIPHYNEFVVENVWQEIYHFKLETMSEIRKRTCDFLKPYIRLNSGLTDAQRSLCIEP